MNVEAATRFFIDNPSSTKYFSGQPLKNCTLRYEKDGDIIKKVLTRKSGTETTGFFRNGKNFKTLHKTNGGTVEVLNIKDQTKNLPARFQAEKITTISMPNGDMFSRITGAGYGTRDIWQPKDGVVQEGFMASLYKSLKNNVLNN